MSAEPADVGHGPTRGYAPNAEPGASVIPLNKHRPHGGVRRAVRGWRTMTQNPDTPRNQTDAGSPDPVAEFAHTIELSFLDIGRSLAEPDTEAVFLRTLDVWENALKGSCATGIIDSGQLSELTAVLEGMRRAPRLV